MSPTGLTWALLSPPPRCRQFKRLSADGTFALVLVNKGYLCSWETGEHRAEAYAFIHHSKQGDAAVKQVGWAGSLAHVACAGIRAGRRAQPA